MQAPADHGVPPTQRPKPSWAMVGIFLILALAAVTLARSFLMPLTLSMLLFFVFAPACRALARIGVPQALSAAAVSLALFAGLVVATAMLAVPLASAIDDAPTIFRALDDKLASLQGSVKEIQEAVEQIDELSAGQDRPQPPIPTASGAEGVLTNVALTTPSAFAQLLFTLILLFFALASRELLYRRIVQSFSIITDKRKALSAMHEIEESLGQYLGAITLINAGLGIAVGVAMWAWGMPSPALFGVAAFLFNFVPYFGAIAGVLLATIIALIFMEGLLDPILVGLTYLALTSAEGQFVTPYFVSQRLRLNTVVVFAAVALFAWLWSVVGMIVAVPLLVVLKVVCASIPSLKGLSIFLSGDDSDTAFEEEMPSLQEELPETQRQAPAHKAAG